MIHEIAPEVLDNQYRETAPEESSRICLFKGREILVKQKAGRQIDWPEYGEVKGRIEDMVYLFSVSGRSYFMAKPLQDTYEGCSWIKHMDVRDAEPVSEAMAGMTAIHLYQWYKSVQYCGCCGAKAVHDRQERMMRCPSCGNLMFPKIAPAIIVAVTDGERLLVTKYAGRNNPYFALVAGFIEIGETAEECVQRELLEEVGIHVKHIRYYGSQPWGFAGNLMLGYTAELDGTHKIDLDRHELAMAKWLLPEEISEIPDFSSLTREMIRRFRNHQLFPFQTEKTE